MTQVNRLIFGRETSLLRPFPRLQRRLRLRYLQRRAFAVPQGRHILCRTLGEYKLYVDPDDRDISPHLMADGYWEPRTTEAIVDRLGPGMTAIDAGANLGYFSILMGALVGPRGKVVAFEPNPMVTERLRANIALNGFDDRVRVHGDALGDEDGREMDLFVEEGHPGGGNLADVAQAGRSLVRTVTRRLDLIEQAQRAVLVKIDAEGSEERIWRGMTALIAGNALRYVIIEFTRESYRDAAGILDEAVAAGFKLMRLDDRRGVQRTTCAAILDGPAFQILVFQR